MAHIDELLGNMPITTVSEFHNHNERIALTMTRLIPTFVIVGVKARFSHRRWAWVKNHLLQEKC